MVESKAEKGNRKRGKGLIDFKERKIGRVTTTQKNSVKEEDKLEALKILMRHYHAEDFVFNTKPIPVTTVFKLVVEDMTGKRRNNIH